MSPSKPTVSAQPSGQLLHEQRAAVVGGYHYELELVVLDDYPAPHGALLAIRFYDHQGQIINDAIQNWNFSNRYKRWTKYIATQSPEKQADPIVVAITCPRNASLVELLLVRWRGSPATRMQGVVKVVQKGRAEPLAVIYARSSDEELLDFLTDELRKADVSGELIELSLEYSQTRGSIAILHELRRWIADRHAVGTPHRDQIAFRIEELTELDKNWLPHIADKESPPPFLGKKRSFKVAHIAGKEDESHAFDDIIDTSAAKLAKSARHLILIPNEYTDVSRPTSACASLDYDDLTVCRLTYLGNEGRSRVGRIPLLTMDALLALHICREHKVGLVHAYRGHRGYDLAMRALSISRQLKVPFIFENTSPFEPYKDMPQLSPSSDLYKSRLAQEARFLREADAVITGSEASKLAMCDQGVEPARIYVVPPSSDVSKGQDASKFSPVITADSQGVALIAGSLSMEVLQRIMNCTKTSKKIRINIFGNNKELSDCRIMLAKFAGHNVHFWPNTKLDAFLRSSWCLLLPGRSGKWSRSHLHRWLTRAMERRILVVGITDDPLFARLSKFPARMLTASSERLCASILADPLLRRHEAVIRHAEEWWRHRERRASLRLFYERVYDSVLEKYAEAPTGRTLPGKRNLQL